MKTKKLSNRYRIMLCMTYALMMLDKKRREK